MLKEEREARKWYGRLRKLLEDRILHLEALVVTMVVEEDDLNEEKNKLKAIDALDYDELGFIKYVEALQTITGVLIENQPSIQTVYQEERRAYVEGYGWFSDTVMGIINHIYTNVKDRRYATYSLDNNPNTVGVVIKPKDVLDLLEVSPHISGVGITLRDRERVVINVIQQLVTKLKASNYNVGIIGIRTGTNTYTGSNYILPLEMLVSTYNVVIDNTFTIFISTQELDLPDVYLPKDITERKKFLKAYRDVGFNNKFYEI